MEIFAYSYDCTIICLMLHSVTDFQWKKKKKKETCTVIYNGRDKISIVVYDNIHRAYNHNFKLVTLLNNYIRIDDISITNVCKSKILDR